MIFIYSNNEGSCRQFMPFVDYFKKKGLKYSHIVNFNKFTLFGAVNGVFREKIKSVTDEKIYIYVGNYLEFIQVKIIILFLKKNIDIIYRARGISPEESYLKKECKWKFQVLSILELVVLKKASFILTVSNKQKEHYINKYNINKEKIITIHNYNSINKFEYDKNLGYIKEVTYVGGASSWQQIDKVFSLFKTIQAKDGGIKFLICTNKEFVDYFNIKFKEIKNIEILSLEYEELIKRIAKSSLGIIFRDNHVVNRVSSPFKVIDYFNANLPLLITNTIGDYSEILSGEEFVKIIDYKKLNEIEMYSDEIIEFIELCNMNREEYSIKINKFRVEVLNIDNEIESFLERYYE